MKTPRFWQKNGIFPTLLTPLGWVYGAATQLRLRLGKPRKCKAKVICIGNITAGGVGKTPVAMAMAEQYIKAGKKVFFVTRGYKGKLKNIVVNLERHTAAETGDEARLLAGVAPTIIAPRRELGAERQCGSARRLSLWMTVFRIRGCIKTKAGWYLTVLRVSATAKLFRRGRCARR